MQGVVGGLVADPMQQAVHDALIAFMAATSQARAEATKGAAYLRRKPSYTRAQLDKVRTMLGQEVVGIAQIARETGLTRQTVYRIKGDPAGAEVLWQLGIIMRSARSCGRHLGDYNPAQSGRP
jgi:putative DNA-invertase from lambdoid prophage Rac